jgi:hypothetical protein
LRVPRSRIEQYIQDHTRHGKAVHRSMLIPESVYSILEWYQSRLRGIAQYYSLAYNVHHLWRLHRYMETALLKTLAAKHQRSVRWCRTKYATTVLNDLGQEVHCLAVQVHRDGKAPLTARFGGLSLRRRPRSTPRDIPLPIYTNTRSELLDRLLADQCEICAITDVPMEIHHIRALKDLNRNGQSPRTPWVQKMAAMQRLTLALCHPCHQDITHGRYDNNHAQI